MPGLHRHPIALLVALMLAGAAPVHATPDSLAATTEEQTRALQQSLREAAQQGAQGDTLGALIGFERLLAEPGLAKLPADDRTEAYVVAGWIALQLSQPPRAATWPARGNWRRKNRARCICSACSNPSRGTTSKARV